MACQESSKLSAVLFAAYQEARFRLREKAKTRGFLPISGSKGRGKGKGTEAKGKMSGMGKMSGEPAVRSWESAAVWQIALPTRHVVGAANRDTGNVNVL